MATNQTRNVFFDKVYEQMICNTDIVIVSVDLAGPPFDRIRSDFPDRYVSVGIAEQNAVALACGLASTGKKVIVYAANPFPFLRALDQIRNCACVMELPITIVGLGTGFSVAECGTTHLTIEDIALASLCAGLDIYSISDDGIADYLATHFTSFSHPTYLRFGKWSGEKVGSVSEDVFGSGFRIVKQGKRIAVVGTGCTTQLLLKMDLPDDYAILDWFKLSDCASICESLSGYDTVITVEEHQRRGGIGSILLERFNDLGYSSRIHRIGIDLKDGYPQEYGNREYWLEKYGITREHILSFGKGMQNET